VDVISLNFSASEKEEEMLCAVAKELQTVIDVPLQIETKNAIALEKTLREYNGVAIVVTDEESKESLLPVVKKYGAVLVVEN
jgi:5-methyltetrahydrofolate--homocysteine methyltransferase